MKRALSSALLIAGLSSFACLPLSAQVFTPPAQNQGGGQNQVPCLKITDDKGETTWLYESSAIIQYLQNRFAA